MTLADKRIAATLFVLAWVTFAWFYGGVGWNQNAHFDLTRAIVERQTLYIDGYHRNTGDISTGADGRIYINKAPGVSFLAALPYSVVYAFERAAGLTADQFARPNAWIVTAVTCGLSGALIGVVFYVYARQRLQIPATASVAVSLALLFGTMVFPYSTMLFAHVPTALFLLIAFATIERRPLLAGVAIGIATLCFYVCALAAAVLAIMACLQSRRHLLRFVAGAIPFAIVLGVYQWICFGSPFLTAVESSTAFTDQNRLFGVLGYPTREALEGITFSPHRGLFFSSPVLVFGLAGFVRMVMLRERRRELAAIASICVVFLSINASFNGWHGGWTYGPRYLLPMVPLLAIPMLYTVARAPLPMRALWTFAAVVSIALSFIATSTDAMPRTEVRNPIRDYLVPAFLNGRVPEETAVTLGWPSTRVDKVSVPIEAGNLGEQFFEPGTRSSVMPIAAWLLIGSGVVVWMSRRVDRAFVR